MAFVQINMPTIVKGIFLHCKTALYTAFDVFPAPKGASTHIAHCVKALARYFDEVHLIALGYGEMPAYQKEGNIIIRRALAQYTNFLERTEHFAEFVTQTISTLTDKPDVIQFRDIWSGIPLLQHTRAQNALKIYEVNGLPSVELPYHYPRLLRNIELMRRLKAMEHFCLQNAHGIITVSQVNKRCLISRKADAAKIIVIPNTATPNKDSCTDFAPNKTSMIFYAGTLAPWQGAPILLQAFDMLHDKADLKLVLACSTRKYLRPLRKQIKKLGLKPNVEIKIGLSRELVSQHYRQAVFSVAPLTRCSRNELQGCSPLKIIESMSAGTPVIASRLAVCSEIINHAKDGWLVTPDSPRALALAMEKLLDDSELVKTLGCKAHQKFDQLYSYSVWLNQLKDALQTFDKRRRYGIGNSKS